MESSHSASSRISKLQAHLTAAAPAGKTEENSEDSYKPLQKYRKLSTINPYLFKEIVFGRLVSLRDRFFEIVVNNPTFTHQSTLEEPRHKLRQTSFRQMRTYFKETKLTLDDYKKDPAQIFMASDCLFAFDQSISIKFGVHFHLYTKTVMNMGTAKHYHLVEKAARMEDIGSFCLTELGHGSNARDVMTTAHYDTKTKEFIINTPSDLAMKFWIGATANLANMTVVFAQLYIGETHYGPHAFVVPIRNKKNHNVLPGITIGDCGSKNGCNGIDNGFLLFKNVRVPRDNLLDRFSGVTSEGEFVAQIKNPEKRFGIQLGSLSGGRINISNHTTTSLINALTIATRFSAVRRQFGLPGKPENPILEYQLIQARLIPRLASAICYKIATLALALTWEEHQDIIFDPKNPLLSELHAISSAIKPLATWNSDQGVNMCREVCGGLGYSSYSRLGDLLQDNNINMTWEGDNSVLIQQTAKFLIDNMSKLVQGEKLVHESLNFMTASSVSGERFKAENREAFLKTENLKYLLEHRTNYLVQTSGLKLQENLGSCPDPFTAWNSTQVFALQQAAKAYGELYVLNESIKALKKCNEAATKTVLQKLVQTWVLFRVTEDIGVFRENDFLSTEQAKMAKDLLLELCSELKAEAVGIIDAIAPPDEVLGSPLGAYDGDIYNKFLAIVKSAPGCFEKISWWREIHGEKN